jgi:hypothetical protein
MIALHHQIAIVAEPAVVCAAIATSAGNRGWWTPDSLVESKVGGKAEFGFDNRVALFRMTAG